MKSARSFSRNRPFLMRALDIADQAGNISRSLSGAVSRSPASLVARKYEPEHKAYRLSLIADFLMPNEGQLGFPQLADYRREVEELIKGLLYFGKGAFPLTRDQRNLLI